MDLERLKDPFPAEDVEWRLAQCGESGGRIWAKCLAYVTNRGIMNRLDAVCGPANWRNEFVPWAVGGKAGQLCGISIRMMSGEWVTKWDGAEQTDVEPVKGGLSDAMKRAAVQWGIGRYLYDLEEGWAEIADDNDKGAKRGQTKDKKNFRWRPPQLPAWALPKVAATNPGLPPRVQQDVDAARERVARADAMKDFVAALKAATQHRKGAGLGPTDKTCVAEAVALRHWQVDGFGSWGELQDALGPARFAHLTRAMDMNPTKFENEVHIAEEKAA